MAQEAKKPQEAQKDRKSQEARDKEKEAKKPYQAVERNEVLVRILGYDIPGSRNIYSGLTRIKGVSWAISNAACIKLNIPRGKKIEELSKDEIKKIENFLKSLELPDYLLNRRKDQETGLTAHYLGSDLDIKREFDIKRMREIKSYKGIRHGAKLPVRGQRTRSHFRTKGKAMGIKRKKTA